MRHLLANEPIPPADARAMLCDPTDMATHPISRRQAWETLKAATGHPITARQRLALTILARHADHAATRAAERMAAHETCPLRPTTPGDAA